MLRMRTLKLVIAYDGTNYVGWQRQLNGVSVQQRLEEAFAPLVPEDSGGTPTVAGASRTDAGVHALGQVASVTADIGLSSTSVQRALNMRLPPDIRVVAVADARPGFHARCHAIGKVYRYRMTTASVLSPFDRGFTWHWPVSRDAAAIRTAARAFIGRHDFRSFQADGSSVRHTVRTIQRLDVAAADGETVIEIEGDGFLRHMVRIIVGTLAEVGSGNRAASTIADVIAARDRRAAGVTAPAAGLTLVAVRY
jgi:tRNA pseudouridine38-40 synthase